MKGIGSSEESRGGKVAESFELGTHFELGRSFGDGNHFLAGMIPGNSVEFFMESLVVLRGEKT